MNRPRAPDNMRICVKYACKNSKYSLIENLRSSITHKNYSNTHESKKEQKNETIVVFFT